MKAVKITLADQEYCLIYNGSAMFEIDELLAGENLFEAIQETGKRAFGLICKIIAILSEQGELTRRALGYSPEEMLTEDKAGVLASPVDINVCRKAILNAVMIGYGREIEGKEDIDVGLLELEQKKTKK